MNNQTALLKVVENFVYFNVKADTTSTVNVGTTVAVTTTPQSVSVGLVMTVTPQISAGDAVILNVRPTISSISELKEDPNPSIPAGIKNYVPQIRTREIESVMRVTSSCHWSANCSTRATTRPPNPNSSSSCARSSSRTQA